MSLTQEREKLADMEQRWGRLLDSGDEARADRLQLRLERQRDRVERLAEREPQPKVRFEWARRRLSHEFRFALLLTHRRPRHDEQRIQMAHCMRKALGRQFDPAVIARCYTTVEQ